MLNKGTLPRFLTIILFLSVFLIAMNATGCDLMPVSKLIEEGEFEGIQIGASKPMLLETLREKGTRRIQIRDSGQQLVTHAEQLSELIEASRLVVTDHAATAVTLDFENDVVESSVISANIPEVLKPALKEGSTRERAFSAIAVLMDENDGLEAFDAIPGISSSYVEIDHVSEAGNNLLMKYDIWFFTMLDRKPLPAAVLLYFDGDELVRIEYEENWGY